MIQLSTHTCPETQYSVQFLQGMIDRMTQGYHKYGHVGDAIKRDGVNFFETMKVRGESYEETGNTEWLIDVANYAMCEFMHPSHPNAHYRGTEGGESPGRFDAKGEPTPNRKNPPSFHRHEGD